VSNDGHNFNLHVFRVACSFVRNIKRTCYCLLRVSGQSGVIEGVRTPATAVNDQSEGKMPKIAFNFAGMRSSHTKLKYYVTSRYRERSQRSQCILMHKLCLSSDKSIRKSGLYNFHYLSNNYPLQFAPQYVILCAEAEGARALGH
jgi:hypothetical protein